MLVELGFEIFVEFLGQDPMFPGGPVVKRQAEAVRLVKASATAAFDETVEAAFQLGIDARQADQGVRGTVSLPNGTGKDVRVLVFAEGGGGRDAESAGADRASREPHGSLLASTRRSRSWPGCAVDRRRSRGAARCGRRAAGAG